MLATIATTDVTPKQLERYATLIYDKIGVTISAQKSTLLSNRLRRRLRATGIKDYDAYYSMLVTTSVNEPEWQAFLQEITTHETYLYRDETHWKWFREVFLRKLNEDAAKGTRTKTLRCWSAASSTGDEAATMACCIADSLSNWTDWKVEILGTDIGADAVAQATAGRFGNRAMRNVPALQKKLYFDVDAKGEHTLKPELRALTKFKVHNLLKPVGERAFDIVFLKNVLIYFDKNSKRRVIDSIRGVLKPGSTLVTGASEGVADLLTDFSSTQAWLHSFAPAGRS